jgi:transketolase
MDKAAILQEGKDITIIACGEMVFYAKEAGRKLAERGVSAGVIDMYCVKPLDKDAVLKSLYETRGIITIEEHSPFGGMGSMISQIVGSEHPVKIKNLTLPDAPVITGNSKEVFAYYNLNSEGIVKETLEILKDAGKVYPRN